MGNRRKSRELALQALFYIDMSDMDARGALSLFYEHFTPPRSARPFFLTLVFGVMNARDALDDIIEKFSSHWKIERMSCVDRNILRIAAFELLCCPDIPQKVSINEAIDIGKKFGTEDSGAFINGILDSIRQAMERDGLTIDVRLPTDEITQFQGEQDGE